MKKILKAYKKHPFWISYLFSFASCFIYFLLKPIISFGSVYISNPDDIIILLVVFLVATFCLSLPLVLTIFNLVHLFLPHPSAEIARCGRVIEYETGILGVFCMLLYTISDVSQIRLSDWNVRLINNEIHSPFATDRLPTIITVIIVGLIGYAILSRGRKHFMPPLILVFGIAASYIGMIGCGLWIYQVIGTNFDGIYLPLLFFNYIIIIFKLMREVVFFWTNQNDVELKPLAKHFGKWLNNAKNWPWLALVAFIPLAIVLVGILALFGQAPDSIIRAFTETADWRLSEHIAPQNIQMDEHYLCTVAAGGHKKVVKPLRLGKRHGHQVVVNRQLCIANAFEQVLEERTPKIHKAVRGFYDRYGYPFAKHIHSKWVADMIYFIMKPLEWIFLAVLYMCDVNPENRIATQYLPGAKNLVKARIIKK